MKYLLLLFATILSFSGFSQKKEDSRIIVTLADTAGIYEKVKTALVRTDFVVKDLPERDTLRTYLRESGGLYIKAFAIINGNQVIISGSYSLKRIDYFGYNNASKHHKKIIYTKGSKTWPQLMKVASLIGGAITYEK